MVSDWKICRNENSLSVRFFWLVVQLWAGNLACLTIFTHLVQVISLQFRVYAWIAVVLGVIVTSAVMWLNRKFISRVASRDVVVLVVMLLLAIATGLLSVTLHEFRRVGPDEYFYTVNPAYFLNHPSEAIDFSIRLVYSRAAPLHFVAFQTSTAYEYIQAALAHISGLSFATVFYVFMAALGGFVIPVSIYLALTCFSKFTFAAGIGTFVTTIVITMLAEANWTPGSLSFVRAFEGKSIVVFAGLPLFVACALAHFVQPTRQSWFNLFILLTAFTGLSSTAIMLFPFLGIILFIIYWLLFESFKDIKHLFQNAISFFSTYVYLVLFAIFIAIMDKIESAYALNKVYPTTFDGYIDYFISPTFPLTIILLIVFSLLALLVIRGKLRVFLFLWMLAIPIFIYNPIAAQPLLLFFRGVYYRLAYLYPFPLLVGIVVATLVERTTKYLTTIWAAVCALILLIALILPTSIFRSDRFAWIPWYELKEYVVAREAIQIAPEGLMLAPYPISGAVSTLNANYPQMIARLDTMEVFLAFQGQAEDGELRSQVDGFLQNNNSYLESFFGLLNAYPEIRSIIIRNEVYEKYNAEIITRLRFPHTQQIGGWRVFWK